MPVQNYNGETFVAFLDISGFRELMKKDSKALETLSLFYQSGYDALVSTSEIEGFFISDCGVLFAREGTLHDKLKKIMIVIKKINSRMLSSGYMLTTSIAYGHFEYTGKVEFNRIEKNPIYGNAYVEAFLNNESAKPRIQPGQCRLVKKGLPSEIDFSSESFNLLTEKSNDKAHLYYYWNLENNYNIKEFEDDYNDSYNLKYSGMLRSLKKYMNNI